MQVKTTGMFGAAVRAALFIVLLAALLTFSGRDAWSEPEGQDPRVLLRRMLSAEQKRAYQAREITFIVAGGRQSEQVVKHDPRRGQRTEFVRPAGDVLIDNFKRAWFLSGGGNRLVERDSRLARLRGTTQATIKAIERGSLIARWDGSDRVVGRDADIVRVSPPASVKAASRRFWIDRDTGLRLKTEEIGAQGRVLSSSYYVSLDLNPRFSSDDFAAPKPRPGMRVERKLHKSYESVDKAQKDVKFTIRRMTDLPEGFTLRAVSVVTQNDSRMVIQRYANGLNLLTLFQTDADIPEKSLRLLRARGADGAPGTRGPRAHTWSANGVAFALIGNMPQEQLKRFAASVK